MKRILAPLSAAIAIALLPVLIVALRPDATAHFLFARILPYPAQFRSASTEGPLSLALTGLVVKFPAAELSAAVATGRVTVEWLPPALGVSSRLSDVRIQPKFLESVPPVKFRKGSLSAMRHPSGTRIIFDDWESEAVRFNGMIDLTPGGEVKQLRVTGKISPAFLISLFPGRQTPASQGSQVPFDATYSAGKIEINANGKPWFRSTWVMRH